MHAPWSLIFRIFALLLFFLGIFWGALPVTQPSWRNWNLISAGLFCWILSTLVS